jgi:hypothetical protein
MAKAGKASSKKRRTRRPCEADTSENLPDRIPIDMPIPAVIQRIVERVKWAQSAEGKAELRRREEARRRIDRHIGGLDFQLRQNAEQLLLLRQIAEQQQPPQTKKRRKYRKRQPKFDEAAIIKVIIDYLNEHDGRLPPTKPGRRPSIDGLVAVVCRHCDNRRPPIARPEDTGMKDICNRVEKMWRAGR